jgi:hypothetical protein
MVLRIGVFNDLTNFVWSWVYIGVANRCQLTQLVVVLSIGVIKG